MSQENVEVVLDGADAINRRDPDGFIACLHPEVVWEESGDVLPGLRGTYRGHSEAREWFEPGVPGSMGELPRRDPGDHRSE